MGDDAHALEHRTSATDSGGRHPPLTTGMPACRRVPEGADAVGLTTVSPRGGIAEAALGECDDWGSKLLAVHVLAHESIHLAGVVDEATADYLAMQVDAQVAQRLGAGRAFASSLAREYWRYYYPSQEGRYRSPSCRDGRAFDLFPDLPGWPTPAVYPLDFAQRVGAFAGGGTKVAAQDGGP